MLELFEFDIVGRFPPWWDWLVFTLYVTTLLVVATVGGLSRIREDENQVWFKKLLSPSVVLLALALGIFTFGLFPNRGELDYLLLVTAMAFVALLYGARLAFVFTTHK